LCSFYLKQHLAEVETNPDGSKSLMLRKERSASGQPLNDRVTFISFLPQPREGRIQTLMEKNSFICGLRASID